MTVPDNPGYQQSPAYVDWQGRVRALVDEMRAEGIHIGIGDPARCVTCYGEPWPCPASLEALAAEWERRAATMERECKHPPCAHSHGYHQAARELRQALPESNTPLPDSE